MKLKLLVGSAWILWASAALTADVATREANDGNIVMQNVPQIPNAVINDLNRYQNVRSASMQDWSADGQHIFVKTRFDDVQQIHRVEMPGGARHQLTYFNEPVGGVSRRPNHETLLFSRDADGGEFVQLFMLNPQDASTALLTDGTSRNGAATWDRSGRKLAYQSTRRNGAANDIWMMDPDEPANAKMILESPDGSWWGPQEFSESGSQLLVLNYVSIADSRIHFLDLDSGQHQMVSGGGENASANFPIGFDAEDRGVWLITDQGSEFGQLAWQSLNKNAAMEYVTGDIPWNISSAAISHDRKRIAFVSNENGLSRLYLMDAESREYRTVNGIPTGTIFGLTFSPDDRRLAMTLNTPRTPSDTFVLTLRDNPQAAAELTRWTHSEVGGLETSAFITPELIHYPTFDTVDGKRRQIPAWVYKPAGKGPFPVVVSIHGGPEGQSRPFFSSTYQMWMAKLGVAVVVPNVRGSSGYGKSYLALDNGYLRENSVKDIGALLDWIATNRSLDEAKVAVFGGSYGGYMVLASAVHFSEKLRAAVDIVGISNFATFLQNTQDYRRDLRRQEYGDERDPDMYEFLQNISPLNNVAKIDVPLFIVQGQNDPRVPVTESGQMVDALRDQGLPVWYMNALNEGHGYKKKENRDLYQQAVVLFFRQHLLSDN